MICHKTENCVNCHDHFQRLRPLVREIIVSKQFQRDAPDFDVNTIVDCQHAYFTKLHKFEEKVDGGYLFRAIKDRVHIVYCIDDNHCLVFLRAFHNFTHYKKFLNNKREIAVTMKTPGEQKHPIVA
jgi:hypothetical protein